MIWICSESCIFIKIFKSFGLSVAVTTNVRFDLTTDIYKPSRKPNDEPVHINKYSNYPPKIVGQISLSVISRISNVSPNQSILNSSFPMYKEVLKNSGFNDDIII